MTQEEYNRLDTDFAHCAGTHCGKASECLRHTAYKMLAGNGNETYTMVNPAVIKGAQPCPLFDPDHKERYAWGISRIYDNVRAADLHGAKWKVMSCFGADVYYKPQFGISKACFCLKIVSIKAQKEDCFLYIYC